MCTVRGACTHHTPNSPLELLAAFGLHPDASTSRLTSLCCFAGILKELQLSRQTRMEEVHLDTSAWLAVLGAKGLLSGSRAS